MKKGNDRGVRNLQWLHRGRLNFHLEKSRNVSNKKKQEEGPGETSRNSPSSQGDKERQQFMQIFKTHEIA